MDGVLPNEHGWQCKPGPVSTGDAGRMLEFTDNLRLGWRERSRVSTVAIALAVSAVAAGAVGCGKTSAGGDAAGAGAMQAMPVQVQVAKSQKIPDSTEYLSILKSRNSSIINPQVEGYITKIFVKSGDRHRPAASLLCMTVEQLNGLQPEPQIISGSGADLRLLRDIGPARTALPPAVVKVEQASNGCDKPHIMRQVSLLRLLDCMDHGQLATEISALALLLENAPTWRTNLQA